MIEAKTIEIESDPIETCCGQVLWKIADDASTCRVCGKFVVAVPVTLNYITMKFTIQNKP